jgi:uncharacterized membrane protein
MPTIGPTFARRSSIAGMLLAIMLLASAVRFFGLTSNCLWYDEIWHVELSNGHGSAFLHIPTDQYIEQQPNYVSLENAQPWIAIPSHMDYVLHPPLYHLLLRIWRELLGDSPWRLRAFSAVMSVTAIGLTFEAARRAAGARAGLIASLLMALSLSQIEQAQDGRGYTLLLVLGLITAITLQSLLVNGLPPRVIARRAAIIGLGAFAMMLTHYFAAGAALAMGLFAVAILRGKARAFTLIGLTLAGAIWLALWWPTLREQLGVVEETADIFLKETQSAPTLRTLLRLLAMPATLLIDAANQASPARIALGLLIAAGVVWSVVQNGRRAALWAIWLVGVIAAVALLDFSRQTRHLTFVRYVLLAAPALCVLLAMHARRSSRPREWIIIGVVLIAELIALPGGSPRQPPDVRPMMSYLQANVQRGDMLVLPSRNPLGRDAQVVYLYIAYMTDVFPAPMIITTRPLEASQLPQSATSRRMWVVSLARIDAERVVPGGKVAEAVDFPEIGRVSRLEPPPGT